MMRIGADTVDPTGGEEQIEEPVGTDGGLIGTGGPETNSAHRQVLTSPGVYRRKRREIEQENELYTSLASSDGAQKIKSEIVQYGAGNTSGPSVLDTTCHLFADAVHKWQDFYKSYEKIELDRWARTGIAPEEFTGPEYEDLSGMVGTGDLKKVSSELEAEIREHREEYITHERDDPGYVIGHVITGLIEPEGVLTLMAGGATMNFLRSIPGAVGSFFKAARGVVAGQWVKKALPSIMAEGAVYGGEGAVVHQLFDENDERVDSLGASIGTGALVGSAFAAAVGGALKGGSALVNKLFRSSKASMDAQVTEAFSELDKEFDPAAPLALDDFGTISDAGLVQPAQSLANMPQQQFNKVQNLLAPSIRAARSDLQHVRNSLQMFLNFTHKGAFNPDLPASTASNIEFWVARANGFNKLVFSEGVAGEGAAATKLRNAIRQRPQEWWMELADSLRTGNESTDPHINKCVSYLRKHIDDLTVESANAGIMRGKQETHMSTIHYDSLESEAKRHEQTPLVDRLVDEMLAADPFVETKSATSGQNLEAFSKRKKAFEEAASIIIDNASDPNIKGLAILDDKRLFNLSREHGINIPMIYKGSLKDVDSYQYWRLANQLNYGIPQIARLTQVEAENICYQINNIVSKGALQHIPLVKNSRVYFPNAYNNEAIYNNPDLLIQQAKAGYIAAKGSQYGSLDALERDATELAQAFATKQTAFYEDGEYIGIETHLPTIWSAKKAASVHKRTIDINPAYLKDFLSWDVMGLVNKLFRQHGTEIEIRKTLKAAQIRKLDAETGQETKEFVKTFEEYVRNAEIESEFRLKGLAGAAHTERRKDHVGGIEYLKSVYCDLMGFAEFGTPMPAKLRKITRTLDGLKTLQLLGGQTISAAQDLANLAAMRGGSGLLQRIGEFVKAMVGKSEIKSLTTEELEALNLCTQVSSNDVRLLMDAVQGKKMQTAQRVLQKLSGIDRFDKFNEGRTTDVLMNELANFLLKGTVPKRIEFSPVKFLSQEWQERIAKQMSEYGEFDGKRFVSNLSQWDDFEAIQAMRGALTRVLSMIIIRPSPGQRGAGWYSRKVAPWLNVFSSFNNALQTQFVAPLVADGKYGTLAQYILWGTAFCALKRATNALIKNKEIDYMDPKFLSDCFMESATQLSGNVLGPLSMFTYTNKKGEINIASGYQLGSNLLKNSRLKVLWDSQNFASQAGLSARKGRLTKGMISAGLKLIPAQNYYPIAAILGYGIRPRVEGMKK